MDVGQNYDNTWQYIEANTLAEHHGLIICEAMSGFHIFPGTYYTSALFMQGNIRPLTTMAKCLVLLFFQIGSIRKCGH